ncbi:MAG: hypothetical protein LWW94_10410, partial [Candidatus Desulfofervidaceae bacterium]|nr:hypothetical protein [Candidatus Desulfofervidaceae bacterium]
TNDLINTKSVFLHGCSSSNPNILHVQKLGSNPHVVTSPIIVTTIQNSNNLDEINDFGRLLSESLIHELQVRGFHVVDIRVASEIMVSPRGEIILTRNVSKLNPEVQIGYALVGTYAQTEDGVVVNLRLINLKNKLVISTAQTVIPLEVVSSLLYDSASRSKVNIKIV